MTAAWTRKAATARAHRRLMAIRRKVEDVMVAMGDFSDQDQFICNACDDLKSTVLGMADKLAEDMDEAMAEETLARTTS